MARRSSDVTLEQRFGEKIWCDLESGCIEWMASTRSKGYGQVRVGGKLRYAHQVAWELAGETVPEGWCLDHVGCDNPLCVNPEHLVATTFRDNTMRGAGPPAMNARKVECSSGHAYTPENTRWVVNQAGKMHRRCRLCQYDQRRRRHLEKRPDSVPRTTVLIQAALDSQ